MLFPLSGKLKWGLAALITFALLAFYGSVSLKDFNPGAFFVSVAPRMLTSFLLLLLGKVAIEFTSKAVDLAVKPAEIRPAAHRVWGMAVWAAVALCIVFVFVGDTTTLIIASGFLLISFAIAFSPPLLSLAGWLYITSRGFYSVGDAIETEGVCGEVAEVHLLSTKVWEFQPGRAGVTGKFVSIPNSTAFTKPVAVHRKGDQHVWDEVTLQLPACSDLPRAREIMVKACDEVLGSKKMGGNAKEQRSKLESMGVSHSIPGEPEVFTSLVSGGAELRLRYLVDAKQKADVKSAVSARILSMVSEEKLKLR